MKFTSDLNLTWDTGIQSKISSRKLKIVGLPGFRACLVDYIVK